MPVLRSQRSKPSKKKEEDEMPPPVPASPPPKRSTRTRSKKVSKSEAVDTSDEPKSPTPSTTSSTRSTRTRTRAKPVPVVEEIVMASPSPPPSTRSTRSTKQKKTTVAKDNKPSSAITEHEKPKKQGKKMRTAAPVDPVVLLSPLALNHKEAKKITKVVRKTGKGKSKMAARPIVETTSDEIATEDESEIESMADKVHGKQLSIQQIHKQHIIPLKTSLESGVCEAFTSFLGKLKDKTAEEKRENEFQRLLNSSEMPPPMAPAPKTKAKGRQKRARSPEKTPTKSTKIPESFNFANNDNEGQVPAKKKMIIDQLPCRKVQEEAPEAVNLEIVDVKTVGEATEIETNKISGVPEVDTIKKDDKKVENQIEVEDVEADMFEQSVMHLEDDSDIVEVDVSRTDKKQIDSNMNKEIGESTNSVVMPEKKKSAVALDETYVFETPKDKEPILNTTYTPELFTETPKSRPESGTGCNGNVAANSANGKVSSLVNFFDKTNKEITTANKADDNGLDTTRSISPTCTREALIGKEKNVAASCNELNETYILPSTKKAESSSQMNVTMCVKKTFSQDTEKNYLSDHEGFQPIVPPPSFLQQANSRFMHDSPASRTFVKEPPSLAVVMEEEDDVKESVKSQTKNEKVEPLVTMKPTQTKETGVASSTTSATLKEKIKEKGFSSSSTTNLSQKEIKIKGASSSSTASLAQKDKIKDKGVSSSSTSGKDKVKDKGISSSTTSLVVKEAEKNKEKGISTSSSSSSCSSMKSASSQPCLVTKKHPTSGLKSVPSYGSAGKLNEISKSKPLDEAEKRRLEHLNQKVECSKKKNADWSKKLEKNKLEEEKKLKEKMKIQPATVSTSASSIMKKPAPILPGKNAPESSTSAHGFTKPKFNFGPSSTKITGPINFAPPLSKNPFAGPGKKPIAVPPTTSNDAEMDDSFKTASNASGFLDQTVEGHLSSYDITVYEDLDEDLKHRENKTVPHWASNKEALNVALFSMVLLPEYESKLPSGFPKPDKNYKLFPTRMAPR